MRNVTMAKARSVALSLAVLAAPALAPAAAQAQAGIEFRGNAVACFYPDAGACVPTDFTVFQGLTYDATPPPGFDFEGETDETGFTAFGGSLNNFGLVSLLYPPEFNYSTTNFLLRLTFSAPTGAAGSIAEFGADLRGRVAATNNGVSFTFFDNSETLNYIDSSGRNVEFTVSANNFSVNANQPATDITGQLQVNTVTPEPVSMVLLGTGLFGLAGVARRRRRKNAELV